MRKRLFIFLCISVCLPVHFLHAAEPIKILLVPGHDDQVWGAEYGTTKEADMNLALATRIFNILEKDKRFEVHITRDGSGTFGYTQEFADYFAGNQDAISAFEVNAKQKMQDNIAEGSFIEKVNPPHHATVKDVATRLYGINKWADDNKMDAVIHIHFNDYPRATVWTKGKYTGFVIYMPEAQMANAKTSDALARKIFTQLRKKYTTSTFKDEKGGLIPDQSLIALGSNGTLLQSVRSVLIEYGYIYEKKFRTGSGRRQAYKTMAALTVTGIKNYFSPK